MRKKFKTIPKFKTEDEERDFWSTHDSTDYVDWSKARHVSFPNLKLTTRPITIRLPAGLIDRIKIKANKMDIPYQTYIKQILFQNMSQ
jgi:predicted DNA binding CopG/RHH family protein